MPTRRPSRRTTSFNFSSVKSISPRKDPVATQLKHSGKVTKLDRNTILAILGISLAVGSTLVLAFTTGSVVGISTATTAAGAAGVIFLAKRDKTGRLSPINISDKQKANKVAKRLNGKTIKTTRGFIVVTGKTKKFIEARDKPFRQISVTK